jgi:hypothetical protein
MKTPIFENTTRPADKKADRTARPIRLQIAGADLLLSGRFEQWMPVLLSEEQQGVGAAQVLFDVTSNRSIQAKDDLFAFKAMSVEAIGPQSYRLKGTLTAEGVKGDVEAILQNPPGHTPFFVILFRLDREAFPGLWGTLEDKAARVEASGQQELRPRAWLREPELAAA